jgi:hypothetical protein
MSSISRVSIRFRFEDGRVAEGELLRYLSPRTVDSIVRALPLEGRVARWKEEVYFEVPVKVGAEKPKEKVEKGTIAYWPMGAALCIFYGETQPYSPVNILGKVTANIEVFAEVRSGPKIRVEKA